MVVKTKYEFESSCLRDLTPIGTDTNGRPENNSDNSKADSSAEQNKIPAMVHFSFRFSSGDSRYSAPPK